MTEIQVKFKILQNKRFLEFFLETDKMPRNESKNKTEQIIQLTFSM